jgi:hypothetical protein
MKIDGSQNDTVKQQQRTPRQADGAYEAQPHENSNKRNGSIPNLNFAQLGNILGP